MDYLQYVCDIKPATNFFKDPVFSGFQKTLDSEMKRLSSLGVGVKKRQAETITVEEVALLWEIKTSFGDHSPQTLLDAIAFLNGIHFALQSGGEHRNLQITQFDIVHSDNHAPSLMYTENV